MLSRNGNRRMTLFVAFLSVLIWPHIKRVSASCSILTQSGNPYTDHLPRVFDKTYSKVGDINIGALAITLEKSDNPAISCSKKTQRSTYTADASESIAFAVELVNRSPDILPNVTLGFVVRGTCQSPSVSLATALYFLPGVQQRPEHKDSFESCRSDWCSCSGSCDCGSGYSGGRGSCDDGFDNSCIKISNDVSFNITQDSIKCLSSENGSQSDGWVSTGDDVIGVVSADRDELTTMISSLYSRAQLPVIGTAEVGDYFSDKKYHPYFFRMASPMKFEIRAILKFLSLNNWSYISVVYKQGFYGQSGFQSLDRNIANYRICIATSWRLDEDTNYNKIVAKLLKYPRARAVVLFTNASHLRKLLQAVQYHNATGHFIFIATDVTVRYSGFNYIGRPDDPAIGIFVFDIYYRYVMEFYDHLQQQNVTSSHNPWLRGAYEYIFECSYDRNQTEIRLCSTDGVLYHMYRYRTSKISSLRIDAVLTLAHAADNLLREKCPGAVGKKARNCITGPLLHAYLKNSSFDGFNERVEFDDNQDIPGRYVIGQFVYDYYDYPFTSYRKYKHMTIRPLGVYNPRNDSITFYKDRPIIWSHVNTYDRIIPLTNGSKITPSSSSASRPSSSPTTTTSIPDSSSPDFCSPQPTTTSPKPYHYHHYCFPSTSSLPQEIPESVCSRPCVLGEIRIDKDAPCCWECRRCRDNERVVEENTRCEACPLLTWPDPETGLTTCAPIHPQNPEFSSTAPIILSSIAAICLVITIIIFIAYIVHKDKKVIKASSRELSIIQLLAIAIGYVTVILYQTTPTDPKCVVIFFTFCISFSLLYCPLLVKTIRIYRIFNKGATPRTPRFISSFYQLLFSSCLVVVQAGLCIVDYLLFGIKAKLTQPIWTEKFVECSCALSYTELGSFLSYNIVQVVICSVFAFKVRRLPDNFNESRFISMSVTTNLLIWLAFIPTYFTTDRENVRSFLLSASLLMNHSVALFLLFLPKIYAALFLGVKSGTGLNDRIRSVNSRETLETVNR